MTSVDLDESARMLIDATRDAYQPSASNRARVSWRVEQKLAARAGHGGLRRGRQVARVVGMTGGALVVVSAAAAFVWQRAQGTSTAELPPDSIEEVSAPQAAPPRGVGRNARVAEASPEPVAPPRVLPEESQSAAPLSVAAESPRAVVAHRAAERSSSTQPRSISADMAAEAAMIARAQAATNRGEANDALQVLGEYDRKYDRGVLAEERSAARVFALCAAGRRAEAQAEANRFLARWPRSPQAARVQSSCVRGPTMPSEP